MSRKRTAVLISGRGSNLQALIDAAGSTNYPAEITLVISNVPDVQGLKRASKAGISTRVISHRAYASREAFDAAIEAVLLEFRIDLVCLAGFMRILSNEFVDAWQGRLVNIHPSLLPAFKGTNVHAQVLNAGVRISGCTVHFVVSELDSGPIIAQAAIPVLPEDTEESLAARTLVTEHVVYPLALRLLAEGRVRLDGGRAIFDGTSNAEGALINPLA